LRAAFEPITEDNTELFKVPIRKLGKDGEINPVFDEELAVLGHAELIEPV
jgi:hypothetical protein